MRKHSLYRKRKTYTGQKLRESDEPDPFTVFSKWFKLALKKAGGEPHALSLATATRTGRPSVRMMLLKSFDRSGFVFFTNYNSRKGVELRSNRKGAICFYWPKLHLQVRVEGSVKKTSEIESNEYFQTRPRRSQLAAWASNQSAPFEDYEELLSAFRRLERLKRGRKILRPRFWGGFRLVPDYFEFWSGRPDRLHQRIAFMKKRKIWEACLLYP